MPKVVGVIPARGGSKGIPRKNLVSLSGKPLIQYTIEAALQATRLQGVYVSTEDSEIAEVSKSLGADVIERPYELALDDASTFDVLKHAAQVLDYPDVIVTLQPTSPLRTCAHIDEAIGLLDDNTETVVAVCAFKRYLWRKNGNTFKPGFANRLPRQNMKKMYVENGSIYVTRRRIFIENDSRLGMGISSEGNVKLFEMGDEHLIEIDSMIDLRLMECYLAGAGWRRKNE